MDYMKQILANNLLHLQLLSLIVISMKFEQQNYGFMHCQIQPFGLFDNPLLYWNSKFQPTSTSKNVNLALKDLLHQICFQIHLYKNTSPILRNQIQLVDYVFHFFSIVEKILVKISIGERPFSSMVVEPFIQNLSLFFDMHPRILYNFDDAVEIG